MASNPFATALATLHASALAVAADYSVDGEDPVPIRVIASQPDAIAPFGQSSAIMATNIFSIQRSDVTEPSRAARITITEDNPPFAVGDSFTLTGDCRLDTEGLSWMCGAEPA